MKKAILDWCGKNKITATFMVWGVVLYATFTYFIHLF